MNKGWIKWVWHRIARILCAGVVCTFYRVRAYGMKNIPKTGAVLLLCNHQSFFDPIFSQSWVLRSFHFVARDSLFRIALVGPLIRSLYTIPIRRGRADMTAMRSIIGKLKGNCAVCLYPEGTRTADGKIAEIKPGFGLLSRRGNAPVVPVVIDGAFECWPRNRKLPSFGRVVVSYGEPFSPQEVKQLGDREFARIITERLRKMQSQLRLKLGKEPLDYAGQTHNE